MTLTLELPEEIAAHLEPLPEGERSRYAVALLKDRLAQDDEAAAQMNAWWESLSQKEQQEEIAKTHASVEAAQESRVSGVTDVVQRLNTKYGLNITLPNRKL